MVDSSHDFLLQRVQPAMVGLIDGSLSTLAPIFSVAIVSHNTFYAFVAGLATSVGAGISMAFSEGLSDTGELTGRGSPLIRGGITGIGTFVGGILHSLPFLIPSYHAALVTAFIVVGLELVALAALRARFFSTSFTTSLAAVSRAGAVIVAVSVALGATA
jgi:VIT1/CCC1 family predicted Fe2+/Mn2+ transporter